MLDRDRFIQKINLIFSVKEFGVDNCRKEVDDQIVSRIFSKHLKGAFIGKIADVQLCFDKGIKFFSKTLSGMGYTFFADKGVPGSIGKLVIFFHHNNHRAFKVRDSIVHIAPPLLILVSRYNHIYSTASGLVLDFLPAAFSPYDIWNLELGHDLCRHFRAHAQEFTSFLPGNGRSVRIARNDHGICRPALNRGNQNCSQKN